MRRILVLVASFALVALTAPQAFSALDVHDDIVIDWVRVNSDNTGTAIAFPEYGGPFWATLYEDDRVGQANGSWVGGGTTMIDSFFTFCAQRTTTFSPGTRYDIKNLEVRTLQEAKVLTGYSAWVFDQFNQKVLTSAIDPRINTTANNDIMGVYQAAIWMGIVGWTDDNGDGIFQGTEALDAVGGSTAQLVGDPNSYSIGLASLASEHITYADFLADTSWTPGSEDTEYDMLRTWRGIQLMNVQGNSGSDAQDQMIAYGGPLSAVPEPASLVVWSVLAGGAAGFAVSRKRRRQALQGRWSPETRDAILEVIGGKARL
jgi:hypothetical protein